MSDLIVFIVVAFLAITSGIVSYCLSKRDTFRETNKSLDERINEKLKDRLGRSWEEEAKAINLNEELRKNKHDRNKDGFVMLMIAVLIGAGLYFLWHENSVTSSGDAKGWAVGALDTLLGVVVGYGFSKNSSNK